MVWQKCSDIRRSYLDGNNPKLAFESIRKIMSYTDGINYPNWHPYEIEPFYQKK